MWLNINGREQQPADKDLWVLETALRRLLNFLSG